MVAWFICIITVPVGNRLLNCWYQVVRQIALRNPSGRANLARLLLNKSRVVLADDDYFGFGNFLANDAGGCYAVHAGHRYVHEHYIWSYLACQFDRFEPIGCLTADEAVLVRSEKRTYPTPYRLMVIDDEYAQ
jgi:hypothetical protein